MTARACIGPVSLDDAQSAALADVQPVIETEQLPLALTTGRVLAETLRAPLDLPRSDVAAMDGYALSAEQAGLIPIRDARPIRTGAPLPIGTDRVVMLEEVERIGDAIRLGQFPAEYTNVRRAGSELRRGDAVITVGSRITPGTALAAGFAGAAMLTLRRRVRVGFFCTGNEIAPAGSPLASGQVWNANRPFLNAALSGPEIELRDEGDFPDEVEAIRARLTSLSETQDLIVTTGGSSVGEADYMAEAFRRAGGKFIVHGVALKPGKPVMIGRLGQAIWLGLPGTPIATFVCWHLFGAPLLNKLAGLPLATRQIAHAAFAAVPKRGRTEIFLTRIECGVRHPSAPALIAHALPLLPTFAAEAEALAILPETGAPLHPGDQVSLVPLQQPAWP